MSVRFRVCCDRLTRRFVLSGLALCLVTLCAAEVAPLALAADPGQKVVRLGFVGALSPSTSDFTPFWERLHELGWVEGENLLVERRSAEGHLDRLPALMAEVIDRHVDLLCTYGTPGATAAKNATSTVPIVAWAMRVTALAAKYRLPAIYFLREYVDAGGLMSYGADYAGMIRRGADYADKILRGAKPADLPIEQPTKYLLVVNLKTAQTLGLTIPQSILLRADEVIR